MGFHHEIRTSAKLAKKRKAGEMSQKIQEKWDEEQAGLEAGGDHDGETEDEDENTAADQWEQRSGYDNSRQQHTRNTPAPPPPPPKRSRPNNLHRQHHGSDEPVN